MFKKGFFLVAFICLIMIDLAQAQELAVPRFVSFRRSEINMRTGPGERFPIKFVYHVQNYPVEVIEEHELWRRIREVDGTVGWVHRRMLSGVRYVIITQNGSLYKKPDNQSAVIAHIQKGSLAKLEECPPRQSFCQVTFSFEDKKYKGWMERQLFYGIYPHETIR